MSTPHVTGGDEVVQTQQTTHPTPQIRQAMVYTVQDYDNDVARIVRAKQQRKKRLAELRAARDLFYIEHPDLTTYHMTIKSTKLKPTVDETDCSYKPAPAVYTMADHNRRLETLQRNRESYKTRMAMKRSAREAFLQQYPALAPKTKLAASNSETSCQIIDTHDIEMSLEEEECFENEATNAHILTLMPD